MPVNHRFHALCAVALLSALPWWLNAQNERYTREDFASSITAQDLRMYLSVLASETLEGRETGTPGNDMAAQFLAGQLHGFGIPPHRPDGSWFQDVQFTRTDWEDVRLRIDTQEYRHLWDFLCMKSVRAANPVTAGEDVVFLGYGIDDPAYSDYREDVRGKAILIYAGEPVNEKGRYRLTGTTEPGEWSGNWMKKMEVAREKGVKTVFLIASDYQKLANQVRRFSVGPNITLGTPPEGNWPSLAILSSQTARALMGSAYEEVIRQRDRINKGRKPSPVSCPVDWELTAKRRDVVTYGYNVLGFVEGADPVLKNEIVVLTAHFDHLGRRGDDIFFGADDNGSGTACLLEVAQALSLAAKKGMGPRRSVLFLFVTGEEKGLLGSKFYVENPVFPLENTMVNINVDMVGRTDKKHKDNPAYIYVIGADKLSSDLHRISEEVNRDHAGLELDYTYNDEADPNRYYYRSDHYNFVLKGIPAIFYFSGVHEDYHRPSDTLDKIDFDRTEKVARLVFHLAWELANREERIRVDGVLPSEAGGEE